MTDDQTIAAMAAMTAMTGQAEETAPREEIMMIEALVGVPGQHKIPFDSHPAKDSEAQPFKEEEREAAREVAKEAARAKKGIRVEDALPKAEEEDTKETR